MLQILQTYHAGSRVDEPLVEVPVAGAGAAAAVGSPPESLDVILLQKPKTPLQSAISKPLLSYEAGLWALPSNSRQHVSYVTCPPGS